MKTALPRIFSSSSYERKVGFVQIKKWLEQPPSEADIDSTLLVLGEAYSDNGRNGVHTTKKGVNRHMQFAACTVTIHVANS
jgi:hypothetical protein